MARAKKGGEIGANGEFYKGGAFIATTDRPKGQPKKKYKASGKQIIDYGTWEVPVDESMKSIFSFVQGVYGNCHTGEINEQAVSFAGEDIKKIESLIARFRNGERWFYPDNEIYI